MQNRGALLPRSLRPPRPPRTSPELLVPSPAASPRPGPRPRECVWGRGYDRLAVSVGLTVQPDKPSL